MEARACRQCELIMSFGFSCETTEATTEDGYIIEVDRLGLLAPDNSTSPEESGANRNPIILVPGILADSGSWFTNYPSQGPGFMLAQRGYDIWVMNTREIAHRSRHKTLSQKEDSFDEIGRYDIAAVIDLVLNVTGANKVTLLAYSQGMTGSLVLLSTKAEYNEKVDLLIGYGPVANVTHIGSPIRELIAVSDPLFNNRAKDFLMYDYGASKNKERYGQEKPPAYEVDRITVKTALFSSEGDTIADPEDVSLLAERLASNLLFNRVVAPKDFRHLDFCYGYQATDFLHKPMIETVEKYAGTRT
ncbi:hypothetical protein HPB50_019606 [Hyalomma asiaticum]|uniref:Uncharacterized protein n=1 Tax=Hyalomma asiaticum TaxID=266040 RepID=A0ACB7RPL0_HYAAI|nr:hypothetical protein HPB50_019606 [Hyalomma asiaticum]